MAQKQPKTITTAEDPASFLGRVEPERRADVLGLDAIFRRATGFQARMWGPAIVGYGVYDYRYESGHTGSAPAAGFSPRVGKFALYCSADEGLLSRLGKYSSTKSCLYIKTLNDIDTEVLADIIRTTVAALDAKWGVTAT